MEDQIINNTPFITNDATVMGLLALILGFVFYTSNSEHPAFKKFYKYVPALLMCYLLPSLLNTFGIVSAELSQVDEVAKYYLLPACLVLLTLSIDIKAIVGLGNKAIIMFLTGTVGVVIGGPIALLVISAIWPELLGVTGPEAVWRGMAALAGSWIGGGANMLAMKEIYGADGKIFTIMVTVDIVVANLWMAVLLYLAANHKRIDAKSGADTSAIDRLIDKVESAQRENIKLPLLKDFMMIIAVGFGAAGLAHFAADFLVPYFQTNFPELEKFSLHSKLFWIIVLVTTIGLALSFTKVRKLEAVGASKVGSSLLYVLVATIGLHMDVTQIVESPKYIAIGVIWMLVHVALLLIVGKMIKAPIFYLAVGSKANIGGAASAPVIASAFHPSLAPVGVLLAVLGYALGTYMAWLCGQLLRIIGS
ncbi:hypothetical protein A3Q34_15480 [Colwellia sp. PAMC 20917]|jgi:uncharacterized membrane protein|uniref:DUF819 family protein n=1 Tax=unclassified Colwellia TaxID=196834 RepID=UPI0008790955|nr:MULTISPECIES: DUF819 family protein [unclassified Colwellia]MBA6364095.1 DUF819 family protein [Colwellia sp. BRX8-8]AOW78116.1 hypothetical protein A3Q34_15480 [Colwellia sp. PAMC 20917]MBA6337861.1 DUF819 family protein [Colwellia sp. BRX8-7]MBA6348942.1 DUF819 family protein [Colwellia sp. BRX8-9]MBA6352252.1 DUF819 family protein [Colwellia sp. BRX9-1]|tara:strand:+ start:1491 stop:2753 length:1263 start_codon:yes stop_codon:yes gene_type:complete